MTIWQCEIGFAGKLPQNANVVLALKGMTRFVQRKFKELVGVRADFVFTDVDDKLTESQRESAKVGSGPVTVFHCKIGVRKDIKLADGADYPIRQVVATMFDILFRKEATFNFSGWNASLTEAETLLLKE